MTSTVNVMYMFLQTCFKKLSVELWLRIKNRTGLTIFLIKIILMREERSVCMCVCTRLYIIDYIFFTIEHSNNKNTAVVLILY